MIRPRAVLLLVIALLLSTARTGHGQVSASARPGWTITPYFWLSSLHGTVGVGPLATDVDLSFGDIVDKLKFGLMGTAEYRSGSWVGLVDGIYVSVGDEKAVAIRGDTGRFDLSQKETMIQPMGGYTFRDKRWAVDLLGGFRYWKLNTVLDVDRPRRTTTTRRSIDRHWFDAIGGVAGHWKATDYVHLLAGGDAGGGGSRGTWQAYGSVGVDVWKMISVDAGYRSLSVDYDHDRLLFDTDTRGFVLGVTFRF